MNLEMPGPHEVGHLRIILLIVLGVLIITIPVIMLMLLAKLKARPRPPTNPGSTGVPPVNATPGETKTTQGIEETTEPQGQKDRSPDIQSGSNPGPTTTGPRETSATTASNRPEAGPPNA